MTAVCAKAFSIEDTNSHFAEPGSRPDLSRARSDDSEGIAIAFLTAQPISTGTGLTEKVFQDLEEQQATSVASAAELQYAS